MLDKLVSSNLAELLSADAYKEEFERAVKQAEPQDADEAVWGDVLNWDDFHKYE